MFRSEAQRSLGLLLLLTACLPLGTRAGAATPQAALPGAEASPRAASPAPVASASVTPPPETPRPLLPARTSTPLPAPTVESLHAIVTAERLSCRYGPGAEYLFLYGLRRGANIKLIGRTDGENWNWVYVDGKNRCWVNARFLEIGGEMNSLPVVYPGVARLPVSPYYPPTTVLRAVRQGTNVTVEWLDIPLRAGDEEDENMLHYIVEVWRCQEGKMLFEPLATDDTRLTFVDEAGCSRPSHGRIFVQEKHGFAGPSEIPWPPDPAAPTTMPWQGFTEDS